MEEYSEIITSIRAIANGMPPSDDITAILRKHECTYLLFKCLPAQLVGSHLQVNKMMISRKYHACAPVFRALDESGIKFVVMKGAVLSQAAYGNFAIRQSADIDLFVNSGDVDDAKKIILSQGFTQGRITIEGIIPFNRAELIFYASQSHQIAPFVKKIDSSLTQYANLDINTSLFWGESDRCIDVEFALSCSEKTVMCGVPINKFLPELEFIALCLHHYKDLNSIYLLYRGSLKLRLFCDIYFYLTNNEIDITQVKRICDKYRIGGFVYYCLYYTNEIFGGLARYLEIFFDVDTHNRIQKFGLEKDEEKEWNCSFSQRLFMPDFKEYFCSLLSEKDKLKIQKNNAYL